MSTPSVNPVASPIERVFLEHPRSVNESYLQHFGVAFGFAVRLFGAGCAALVHAFVPCLFEKTASNEIRRLAEKIENRGKAH